MIAATTRQRGVAPLLLSRRLLPLLATQTLGALADNLFKNALVVLILFRAGSAGAAPSLVALAGGVFILPYVLLSATAGQVAERWDKGRLILFAKLGELALVGLAVPALLAGNVLFLFAVLFGLGAQATFFGPLKYGILPAHLRPSELVSGNGLMEAGTFLGILAGTLAGSALFPLPHGPALVSAVLVLVSLAGLVAACFVPRAPSLTPTIRIDPDILAATVRLLADARADPAVWPCILGLSWFWAVGAIVLADLPTLVRVFLHATPPVFSLMLGVFSVGVGLGSVLCARLLRGRLSARLVPAAAVGLALFLGDLGWTASHAPALGDLPAVLHSRAAWHMMTDLLLLAACGGVYSVPLYAVMQDRAAPTARSRMVAANNLVNAVAMAASAVILAGASIAGVGPAAILMITAALDLAVAAGLVRILRRTT